LEVEVLDSMELLELAYVSLEEAAKALAGELRSIIDNAVSVRGQALIAVSGGNTPRHVFKYLSQFSVDWKRVTITLTDERWVPSCHKDSNEALVRSYLLKDAAASSSFVPLYGEETTPQLGQEACESRLKSLRLPFDAVYLGMGTDGHVASLFSGEPIENGNSLCIPVPRSESREARMSLSLPMLLNTEHLMLLYSGAEKHETYLQAKSARCPEDTPISHLFARSHVPVTVFRAP